MKRKTDYSAIKIGIIGGSKKKMFILRSNGQCTKSYNLEPIFGTVEEVALIKRVCGIAEKIGELNQLFEIALAQLDAYISAENKPPF